MKFLFDFFPVLIFYIAYTISKRLVGEVQGMIIATALLIVATCAQVAITWWRKHKVEKMHLVVLALAIVFGGATIYFREPTYLIWKVTLANWLFAIAFLTSHFIGDTPIIKRMMQHAIELPEIIWTRLSYMWILFFAAIGAVNLLVASHVSFDTWVQFKLFGMLGLTFLFVVLQSIYLARHVKEKHVEEA
jgi:intracellular septation protein